MSGAEQIGRTARRHVGSQHRSGVWRFAKRELARFRRRLERDTLRAGRGDDLPTCRRAGLSGWVD